MIMQITPMMYVLGGLLLVGGLWIAGIYNGLIRTRNACDESWADIDTELKRRYDLIPRLVETVKGYMAHEKDLFERVVRARNAALANNGSPASQAKDENMLMGCLRQLMALVENYPLLKADSHFSELMSELSMTEDRIARARRFYNSNARSLSNRIETFPSNLVANLFSFSQREYFEIEDHVQREAPQVQFTNPSEQASV